MVTKTRVVGNSSSEFAVLFNPYTAIDNANLLSYPSLRALIFYKSSSKGRGTFPWVQVNCGTRKEFLWL